MPSLTDLMVYLETEYPQKQILLNYFDPVSLNSLPTLQPKYLFRGEADVNWPSSKSTFSRNLKDKLVFREVFHWVTGAQYPTGIILHQKSLYHFLREALFEIPVMTTYHDRPWAEQAIAGLLQHYGFDTGFIDLTSDLQVAANFAASGTVGVTGQIMVLETSDIEDRYFDLTKLFGHRPKRQSSYVLWGTPKLDLKGAEFSTDFRPSWHRFTLTDEDVRRYLNKDLLDIEDDEVVPHIVDWYAAHIQNNPNVSSEGKAYFKKKIDQLTLS